MPDLIFNVAQLLREETGARRRYEFREPELALEGSQLLRDLHGEALFTRTATGVLVDARIDATYNDACVRCLQPATMRLEMAFEDQFHSKVDVTTGIALPKPDEEDPFFLSEQHMLDLGEAIRAYALMSLPMQLLCRPDCKGLCPSCGVDLNVETCHCHEEPADERFAALRQLLNKEE